MERAAAKSRSIDTFLDQAVYCVDHGQNSCHPISLKYYLTILLPLGIANASDASEVLCLSYIIADSEFQSSVLEGDLATRGGVLASAVFAGMLVGGILVGALADSVFSGGRKRMLLLGLALNALAGISSAYAANIRVIVTLRAIAGLGIGATVPPLFTLVTELAPPSQRGFCIAFVASFWMVGSIFVAIMAMVVFQILVGPESAANVGSFVLSSAAAWRVFTLICAMPSIAGFILVFVLVPESPRYMSTIQHQWNAALRICNDLSLKLNNAKHGFEFSRLLDQ